jgi:DUF4097 and DUF4098 domain-containing protein YvlB
MRHEFTATVPQHLHVELRSGDLVLRAEEGDHVVVELRGSDATDVRVHQESDTVSVVAPKRAGFFTGSGVEVRVTVPLGTHLVTELGSADVTATGAFGRVRVATGSGSVRLHEVREAAAVRTGSGDIEIGTIGEEADLRTGSGRITVDRIGGSGRLTTGSGDITVGSAAAPVVLKSGSGDLEVTRADGDAALKTASGDLVVGRIARGSAQLENVSGDIRICVPDGTPVWTDCSTTTGHVTSDLTPRGAPAQGQDYVEVRAKTLTGDIHLAHV